MDTRCFSWKGLQVVFDRRNGPSTLALGLFFPVGSLFETTSTMGLSHLVEHMVFKGTARRTASQIGHEVDHRGAELNAYTARDHICFHVICHRDDFVWALDILEDIAFSARFPSKELSKEKKVILQELSMVSENPEETIHDLFFEKSFPKQSLGYPIAGTRKSVTNISRNLLLTYYKAHFKRHQGTLVISGDISPEKIFNLHKNRLDPKKFKTSKVSRDFHFHETLSESYQFKPICHKKQIKSDQAHLLWGTTFPIENRKDRFSLALLNHDLGGGVSSQLFQELREKKGLVYTIYTSVATLVLPNQSLALLTTYCASHRKNLPVIRKLTLKAFKKAVTLPQGPKALSSGKKDFLSLQEGLAKFWALSWDTPEGRMFSLGRSIIAGEKKDTPESLLKELNNLTYDDYLKYLQKIQHLKQLKENQDQKMLTPPECFSEILLY